LEPKKVKVEVFLPAGACGCTFARFMEKVWAVRVRNRDKIDFQVKRTGSPEADMYKILGMAVVVNGRVKLPPNFDEDELENAILQEIKEGNLPERSGKCG
jgi:hypothetical protein